MRRLILVVVDLRATVADLRAKTKADKLHPEVVIHLRLAALSRLRKK